MTTLHPGPLLTRDTLLVRDDEPLLADDEGDPVIVSLRAGAGFQFNPVGCRIWQMLQTPVPLQTILDRLSRDYQADPEVIAQDVIAFLQRLVARGLVRAVGTA